MFRFSVRFLVAMVFVVFTGSAWSQPKALVDPAAGRVLGGHRFLPSEIIPGPFITTDFETQTGLGFSTLTLSGTDYNLGVLAQFMRLQVAATDWLAVRVGIDGMALSGVNADAALAYGASAGYDLTAGATASWLLDRLRVSGSFDLMSSQSSRFAFDDAINRSLTAGKVDVTTLLVDTKTTTLAPGAQVAYGFSPAFGGFGHLRLALTNGSGGSDGSTNFLVGAGLSTDLLPISRVPVGFLLGYNLELDFPQKSGAETTSNSTISGGVFYTGRSDLALGVEGSASFSSTGTLRVNLFTANFGIHYFW